MIRGGDYIGTTLFNLIAVLFNKISNFPIDDHKSPISKELSDSYEKIAKDILSDKINTKKICSGDKICVNSQDFTDIINTCENYNDFILYRSVLCQLDMLIDINALIKTFNYNKIYDGKVHKSFNSLNENTSETGVTIIPKVPSLPNTFFVKKDDSVLDKEYKDSNYWYDNINEHFNNIICIKNAALNGYVIKNVVIELFRDCKRDKIVIGVTPCCNDDLSSIMDVKQYCNKETGKQHFKINKYYDPKELTDRFLNVLSNAKDNNVDILMGPEMLGSMEMCETDSMGYNPIFRKKAGNMPHLVITPTVWTEGKNFLSVYLNSGELIGSQYKQNSFEYTDSGECFEEDLKNTPKEILLLHIPGWGRIVLPICVDFLVAKYRDILARELKATLMLCPSYSSGIVQFGNASSSVRDFGTRLIWINSCSALKKFTNKPDTIGLVSVPVTNPSNIEQNATPIKPQCNGKCSKNCLFTITIQAITDENKHCNEVEVKHVPL